MSLRNDLASPRTRMSIGLLCLVIGITFPYLVHPAGHSALYLTHFGRGLLLGFSLVMVLSSWRWAARQDTGAAR